MIEDEASVQAALMEAMNALMRNTIDLKRATLILRALHIAVKNIGRVNIQFQGRDGVREIPEYAAPATDINAPTHAETTGVQADFTSRARREAAASAVQNIADLSIHEPSAAPPTEAPKRIPDPDAGKSRDELFAEYYGYSSVEAYLAGPEAKRNSAAAASRKLAANAVENSTNRKPSTSMKVVPPAQKNKVNGATAG